MAKGRMINKRLCKSKKYAQLTSDRSRVLYVLMYINADREGRVDGDPEEIKDEFCTKLKYTHRKIAESVIELHDVGLIKLYEVNDRPYIQFLEFDKYQPGLRKDREATSEIPDPVRSRSGLTPSLYLSLSLSLSLKNHTSVKKKPPKKKPKKETVKIKKDGKEIEVSFDEAFDYWYKCYPKHVNPKVALDKFKARCRQGQFEEIDQGLTGYLNYIISECSRRGIEIKEYRQYILYPQTFLNKERWKEFIGVKRIANL